MTYTPNLTYAPDKCSCGQHRLYAGRVPAELNGMTHMAAACIPHVGKVTLTCEHGDTFVVTGDTAADRQRAVAEWDGCCCEVAS